MDVAGHQANASEPLAQQRYHGGRRFSRRRFFNHPNSHAAGCAVGGFEFGAVRSDDDEPPNTSLLLHERCKSIEGVRRCDCSSGDYYLARAEASGDFRGERPGGVSVVFVHEVDEVLAADGPNLVGDGIDAVFLGLRRFGGGEGDIGAGFSEGDGDSAVCVVAVTDDGGHLSR